MTRTKVFRHLFRFHGLFESFKLAFKGIYYLFMYHRNMRIIFMLGVLVFLLGLHFQLNAVELVALSATITLVFMAEVFNTAIEMMMDMLTARYRLRIKLVKDIAAAVVLLTCLNSMVVGWILFKGKIFK